jgi:hypothetical protein
MANFKLPWRSIAQAMLLLSAAAFLVCSTGLAQTPVNGFVIINPISVCSGGLCSPFGLSCTSATGTQVCTQFATPSAATVKTPIGFVDADKNVNLTRAFWAQAGIDVAFFPVQSYNSPSNAIPSSWNNIKDASTGSTFSYSSTTYQTLHLVNVLCADGFVALTSPDFQALTQHPICTEHTGLPAGSKLVNPPPAPSTPPPLAIKGCSTALPCSTNSNAIDVFFVNTYSGTGATVPQYGLSWINGDGVSVGKLIFSTTSPRFDTLAHEIGHALALNHLNFGANTDTVNSPVGNMMLLGSTRATSLKSGCQPTTATISNPPPVYNGGALFDLDYNTSTFIPCGVNVNGIPIGNMLADHLTLQQVGAPSACSPPLDPTNCFTQQGAAALSPFINKTLPNIANAGGGTQSASAMTTSTTSSSGTPAPLIITISVGGAPNQDIPDLISSIIALSANDPLSFSGTSPVTQVGGTGCDTAHMPTGCVVTLKAVTKLTNQQVTGNPGCDSGTGQPPSSQCIKMDYSDGFGPDNPAVTPTNNNPAINVILAVNFNKDASTIIGNNLLAGAQYTAIDSNGFATTSLFGNATAGVFTANSQIPDLTTPNVLLDPKNFQNASAVRLGPVLSKCTPPYTIAKIKGQLVTVCPDGNLPDGPD